MANVHDLLLHLRCHAPHLARRLDTIRGLGFRGGVLTVRIPECSWTAAEFRRLGPMFEREAARVFGRSVRMQVESSPPVADPLPFPVVSTKYWNHVVFVVASPGTVGAVAVPKPRYLDGWLPGVATGTLPSRDELSKEDKVQFFRYAAPEATTAADAMLASLPGLLDELAGLARTHRSYAQLALAFPGDAVADRLEARLYGIKEWGTPQTPGPIFHKFVGRIHYLPPDALHLGLRLAAGP